MAAITREHLALALLLATIAALLVLSGISGDLALAKRNFARYFDKPLKLLDDFFEH